MIVSCIAVDMVDAAVIHWIGQVGHGDQPVNARPQDVSLIEQSQVSIAAIMNVRLHNELTFAHAAIGADFIGFEALDWFPLNAHLVLAQHFMEIVLTKRNFA